ncbi:MAG: hypothetical protein IKA22_12490 [Lentisphaeria bacterium]|nr:hypothetical protein [Lentisphaeria bacterium]
MNDLLSAELKNIDSQNVRRIVLTAPVKTSEYRKISAIRLINGDMQIEKLTSKQAFHEKIHASENLFEHEIFSFFGTFFMQLEICDEEFSYSFRAARKRVLFNRKKLKNNTKEIQKTQNRNKNYILNEGMKIKALVDLGVFHADFTLIKKSYAKFKQINRFVEFVDDMLKNAMIRAELKKQPEPDCSRHLKNVENLMKEFSVTPTLYTILNKS